MKRIRKTYFYPTKSCKRFDDVINHSTYIRNGLAYQKNCNVDEVSDHLEILETKNIIFNFICKLKLLRWEIPWRN